MLEYGVRAGSGAEMGSLWIEVVVAEAAAHERPSGGRTAEG